MKVFCNSKQRLLQGLLLFKSLGCTIGWLTQCLASFELNAQHLFLLGFKKNMSSELELGVGIAKTETTELESEVGVK